MYVIAYISAVYKLEDHLGIKLTQLSTFTISELPLTIPYKQHVYTLTDLSNLYEVNEPIYITIRTKLKAWRMYGIDIEENVVDPQLVSSDSEEYRIFSFDGKIMSILIDMKDDQSDTALEVVSIEQLDGSPLKKKPRTRTRGDVTDEFP